jgi:hypothetical protein
VVKFDVLRQQHCQTFQKKIKMTSRKRKESDVMDSIDNDEMKPKSMTAHLEDG